MNPGKKALPIIIILVLITITSVCVSMWALFLRKPSEDDPTILSPDYAPQQKEENAESIPHDTGDKMENPEGGGAVRLTYSDRVTIDLSDQVAALYFANPGSSNQDMVIQIAVQNTILLQSGTLSPGHQVKLLELLDGTEKMLRPGGYEGKFIILYYDPTDGEKALINTEIPITITVVE
jgi:hypothetical protein